MSFYHGLLLVLCISCIITDLKARKIPNKITIPFAIIGLLINSYYEGYGGLIKSLLGMTVALGIMLVPYLSKGIYAGDVKMLMAIGSLMGARFVIGTSVYMALVGGVFALILMIKYKTLHYYLKKMKYYFMKLIFLNTIDMWEDEANALQKIYMPYAVAIGMGAICFLVFNLYF